MKFKDLPFEAIAATGYLSANAILTFQNVIEGRPLIPTIEAIKEIDPSAWQSIAGFLLLISAIIIYFAKKYPHAATKSTAVTQFFANSCLLISGFTQTAFVAHAFGLIPSFLAVFSLLQGNKENSKAGFFKRYPVAFASCLFILSVPPLLYNAILSQDWTLSFVIFLWFVSHIFFGLTDRNFQKKIFD